MPGDSDDEAADGESIWYANALGPQEKNKETVQCGPCTLTKNHCAPAGIKPKTPQQHATLFMTTGLLPCETGGWCHPFSRVDIDVDHKKRVDLGVLRGADHDGLGTQAPFEMVSVD